MILAQHPAAAGQSVLVEDANLLIFTQLVQDFARASPLVVYGFCPFKIAY